MEVMSTGNARREGSQGKISMKTYAYSEYMSFANSILNLVKKFIVILSSKHY